MSQFNKVVEQQYKEKLLAQQGAYFEVRSGVILQIVFILYVTGVIIHQIVFILYVTGVIIHRIVFILYVTGVIILTLTPGPKATVRGVVTAPATDKDAGFTGLLDTGIPCKLTVLLPLFSQSTAPTTIKGIF